MITVEYAQTSKGMDFREFLHHGIEKKMLLLQHKIEMDDDFSDNVL